MATPLTHMLKEAFEWSDWVLRAFEQLKAAMMTASVLTLPDFGKLFVVEIDASKIGVGAVLSQGSHLIAFMSKALTHRARPLFISDKELLTIVLVIEKWCPYLLG